MNVAKVYKISDYFYDANTYMKYIPFFSALTAFAVYFIAGTLFMYFVRGARGIEIIPNVNFWKSLLSLIKVSISNGVSYDSLHRTDVCL